MLPKLHLIARFVLGTVFMLSGALKLVAPSQASELLSEVSSVEEVRYEKTHVIVVCVRHSEYTRNGHDAGR